MSPATTLAVSALFLAVLFVAVWVFARRTGNLSVVDVAWATSFAPVVALAALGLDGWLPRRVLIALLVGGWAARLGSHLWVRVARHHPQEDARYGVLRERWEGRLARASLLFFLAQGALVWLLTLPVVLICRNRAEGFGAVEVAGFSLLLVGLVGEALADWQLRQFKAARGDGGSGDPVCRRGLWRYSRHPNYFFQSLLWWGVFLVALPVAYGWTAVLAPLAMTYFLLRVTGIPLTEKLAVESKGESYREYQRTTSAFVPWVPNDKRGVRSAGASLP